MTNNIINTKNRPYMMPSMQVFPLNLQPQLLAGSPNSMPIGPGDNPYQW